MSRDTAKMTLLKCADTIERKLTDYEVSGLKGPEVTWLFAALIRWNNLGLRFMDPEDLGHAVSKEVRDLVSECLRSQV